MIKLFTAIATLFSVATYGQSFQIISDSVRIEFLTVAQKTKGTIGNLQATVNFNPMHLEESEISGTVEVSTIETGNKMRDNHLKSNDFFDSENFPKISFQSSSISKENNHYTMNGTLTIEDSTHAEVVKFTFSEKVFEGEMTISMSNYDLGMFSKKRGEKSQVTVTFIIPVAETLSNQE